MLDKNKEYAGFSTPRKSGTQPSGNLKCVRILFEDDISYYVESQTETDSAGHGIRRSVKKHCYELYEIRHWLKTTLCKHDVWEMAELVDAVVLYPAKDIKSLVAMYNLLRQDY